MLAKLLATEKRFEISNAHLDDNDPRPEDTDERDSDDGPKDHSLDLTHATEYLRSQRPQLRREQNQLEARCFNACVEARSSEDVQKFQNPFDVA